MYEDLEEIVVKNAISNENTRKIKLLKQNLCKISLEYFFMLELIITCILN